MQAAPVRKPKPRTLCPYLAAFVARAVEPGEAIAAEALAALRAAPVDGFGCGALLLETAAACARAALATVGIAPVAGDARAALDGAADALNAARRESIRAQVAHWDVIAPTRAALPPTLCPDEVRERIAAKHGAESERIAARVRLIETLTGARDGARSGFGFAREADGAAPDARHHWRHQSAQSAGDAVWFAKQVAPDATIAALRALFGEVAR